MEDKKVLKEARTIFNSVLLSEEKRPQTVEKTKKIEIFKRFSATKSYTSS